MLFCVCCLLCLVNACLFCCCRALVFVVLSFARLFRFVFLLFKDDEYCFIVLLFVCLLFLMNAFLLLPCLCFVFWVVALSLLFIEVVCSCLLLVYLLKREYHIQQKV